ncbi:MAG: hypothetical protein HYW89_02680 [Candidatus Sungiibacteriota bacterium]|uniref:Phosphoesterase RecJ domain protein n=1 Tax=Candidatus Sungiibacteriota bacterium TaxID=2750080 RepID=A0A7T5RJN3_9BACT|nr:MAG: hypothetical protein HYW89_02680 [Candidatus Sungbacteria bacterium]
MDIQKATEQIEKSGHLVFLVPESPTLDCLAASEVLASILAKRNKKVGFAGSLTPETIPNADLFPYLRTPPQPLREFVVSLDTSQISLGELRYEKHDNRVEIILSPNSLPIEKNQISFRAGNILCDSVLTLGLKDVEGDRPELPPEFFTEHPIINIDNADDNKYFGEINLVDAKRSSLSEIVYELVSLLTGAALEKEHATLLLAGIVSASGGFSSPQTNADTFLAASELMRLGGENQTAYGLVNSYLPLGLLQLFGRASVRTKTGEKENVLWSFVTKEDFEKTGRTPADTSSVLAHLEKTFPQKSATVLLSQNPEDGLVQATVAGEQRVLEAIRSREGGEFQSPYLKIFGVFPSFREAEVHITSLLKEIL